MKSCTSRKPIRPPTHSVHAYFQIKVVAVPIGYWKTWLEALRSFRLTDPVPPTFGDDPRPYTTRRFQTSGPPLVEVVPSQARVLRAFPKASLTVPRQIWPQITITMKPHFRSVSWRYSRLSLWPSRPPSIPSVPIYQK